MSEPLVDEAFLLRLIESRTEESLTLEYKAAASLSKADKPKVELTKDVSAMANSAGGRIVVGVKEGDGDRRHLPESIDPCDRESFSKEWVEHVLSNIQPRIEDLVIIPVQLSTGKNHVAYVIDIPQSSTAHQASDFRYYRRYNFESVPMHDYEIRDVMNRSRYPTLTAAFTITRRTYQVKSMFPMDQPTTEVEFLLRLSVEHEEGPLARFVNGFVVVPEVLVDAKQREGGTKERMGGRDYLSFSFDNTKRDVVGIKGPVPYHTVEKGPSWFSPLLPQTVHELFTVDLDEIAAIDWPDLEIEWQLHADSAPPRKGTVRLRDIPQQSIR